MLFTLTNKIINYMKKFDKFCVAVYKSPEIGIGLAGLLFCLFMLIINLI